MLVSTTFDDEKFVLVPREPTEAMVDALQYCDADAKGQRERRRSMLRNAIAAAPGRERKQVTHGMGSVGSPAEI